MMKCPICNTNEECDHLLAIIDRTSCCTSGGFSYDKEHQFCDLIQDNFLTQLQNEAIQKFDNQHLAYLWKHASDNFKKDADEVEIDQYVFYDLIGELFEECGAEEFTSDDDNGMPGFSSVERFYYAKDPNIIFEDTAKNLIKLLANPSSKNPDVKSDIIDKPKVPKQLARKPKVQPSKKTKPMNVQELDDQLIERMMKSHGMSREDAIQTLNDFGVI